MKFLRSEAVQDMGDVIESTPWIGIGAAEAGVELRLTALLVVGPLVRGVVAAC